MSPPLRRVATSEQRVFLTFDDGPDPHNTPRVLDVLAEHDAHATFFLVAQRAAEQRDLLQRILQQGHGIGNHSLDHRYGAFFAGRRRMLHWVRASQHAFAELGCNQLRGFRPPAGVRTPELHWALDQLGVPLVLWSQRFFDTTLPFTVARAVRAAERATAGEIVLLHDRQRDRNRETFLAALKHYVAALRERGFQLAALPADLR